MAEEPSGDQRLLNEFLSVPKNFRKKRARAGDELFSPFIQEHRAKVENLVDTFDETISAGSFADVIARARQEAQSEDLELVQQAVQQFVIRNPTTRTRLRIPPLIQRFPRTVLRHRQSKFGPDATAQTDRLVQDGTLSEPPKLAAQIQVGSADEKLAWWLEDPSLNEHHEHYHSVFNGERNKNREGELFVYMHSQMLARYDAERKALGLARVRSIAKFSDPIEGYTPHKELRRDRSRPGSIFTQRQANMRMSTDNVNRLNAWRTAISDAIRSGRYRNSRGEMVNITADVLGGIIQPSNPPNAGDRNAYGFYHDTGHVAIRDLSDQRGGVIGNPRTACRDPVFWRWHKGVDELFNEWQSAQQPLSFNDAPRVQVNNVFFEERSQLDRREPTARENKYAAYAQRTYGGNRFTENNISTATNELQTTIRQRTFSWPEDSGRPETINYVYPREWVYFIRVTNSSNQRVPVTVRIFIVPKDYADDRKAWIEMDKFTQNVEPGARTVFARPCDDSSVIKKRALKTPQEMDSIMGSWGGSDVDNYCDCGWPFHLMLPRGTSAGAQYTLLAMVTDGNVDQPIRENPRCGSVSFCGGAVGSQFPDRRPMGYPFNVPFKRVGDSESYRATFQNVSSAFLRDFTIKEVPRF